jgi:hypothetical protein
VKGLRKVSYMVEGEVVKYLLCSSDVLGECFGSQTASLAARKAPLCCLRGVQGKNMLSTFNGTHPNGGGKKNKHPRFKQGGTETRFRI